MLINKVESKKWPIEKSTKLATLPEALEMKKYGRDPVLDKRPDGSHPPIVV